MEKKILIITLILMLLINSIGFSQPRPIEIKSMNSIFEMANSLTSSKRSMYKSALQGAFTDSETLENFKYSFEGLLEDYQKKQITDLGISFSDIRANIEILKSWSWDDRMKLIEYGFSGNTSGINSLNEKNTPDPGDSNTDDDNNSDTGGSTGGGVFIPTTPNTEPVEEVKPEPKPAKKKKKTNKKETVIMYIDEFITPKAGISLKELLINKGLIHKILPTPTKKVTFNDTTDHWAKANINYFAEQEIINGMGNGNFGPNNNIKEAEILALITRVIIDNTEKINLDNIEIKNIDDSKWYKDTYKKAYILGIIDLEDDIAPESYPSRERIINLFIKSLNTLNFNFTEDEMVYSSTFTDFSEVDEEYKTSITLAINQKLISGNADNTLTPKREISRAEVATILKRYYFNIVKKLIEEDVI